MPLRVVSNHRPSGRCVRGNLLGGWPRCVYASHHRPTEQGPRTPRQRPVYRVQTLERCVTGSPRSPVCGTVCPSYPAPVHCFSYTPARALPVAFHLGLGDHAPAVAADLEIAVVDLGRECGLFDLRHRRTPRASDREHREADTYGPGDRGHVGNMRIRRVGRNGRGRPAAPGSSRASVEARSLASSTD